MMMLTGMRACCTNLSGQIKVCTGDRVLRTGSYLLHGLYDTACMKRRNSGSQDDEGGMAPQTSTVGYHNIGQMTRTANKRLGISSVGHRF